jgi:hypothetical protein
LKVSDTLIKAFREFGVIQNGDNNDLPVKMIEVGVDVSSLDDVSTATTRNLLALFAPENFKVFFRRLIDIVNEILRYIKNTASDFYALKDTGIGNNYRELNNILMDDKSWDILSRDIKKLPELRNRVLIEHTERLEDSFEDIIILGGNKSLEESLKDHGFKLKESRDHDFPFSNYRTYFRERISIIWEILKEIYLFIKVNTWDEFIEIFKSN